MHMRMSLLLVLLLLPVSAFWTITAAPSIPAEDTNIEFYPFSKQTQCLDIATVEEGITMLVQVLARISSGVAITVRNGRTRLHVQDDVKFFVDSLATQDVEVQKDWLKKAMEDILAKWKSSRKKIQVRCPGGHMYFSHTRTLAAGFFKVGFGEPGEKFGLEYPSTDAIVLTEQQWRGTNLSKETAEAMVFYKLAVTSRSDQSNQVIMRLVEDEIPNLYPKLLPNSPITIRKGFTLIHSTTRVRFFLESGVAAATHHIPITKYWVVKAMQDLLLGCKIIKPTTSSRSCGGGHKKIGGSEQIVVGFGSNSLVYREHPLETEAGEQSGEQSKRKEADSYTPDDPKGKRRRMSP
ncbi:unnamed protein product [Calypogeia fissa]